MKQRLTAHRDAGIETLIVSPTAGTAEERKRQLRLVAELAHQVGAVEAQEI